MARRARKRLSLAALTLSLLALAAWQFSPLPAVIALRTLTDPSRLATLGERGANPRLNKCMYWLDFGRRRGLSPEVAIKLAQTLNLEGGRRASLVREALLRNLRIADSLGLFTPPNRDRLRRGRAAVVTHGPCAGDEAEVDHLVPVSLAPEAGNELANLELLPERLNLRKSNRVGARQLEHARRLLDAGMLTPESFARVQARAGGEPAATN